MFKVEQIVDGDRDVYLLAVSVFIGGTEHYAGAFKLDEPPGVFSGGEFVKENGKTKLFQVGQSALDAAKSLYESKKG
ncbi:MAG: hypothetical protein ACI8P0_003933 [Planctomycetaceae bacterium]|jgi:hypothetical protein